ncbi:Pol [Symbiodinium natans]|uniref:Pol protein n=1 Tax=Symbiodinium natans TaxID=878477 RepID=A0A812LBQ8_9DINO|nr:Pol [Symbiodinium natans]
MPAERTREPDTPEGWPWTLLDADPVSTPTRSRRTTETPGDEGQRREMAQAAGRSRCSAQRAQTSSSSSTPVIEPPDHDKVKKHTAGSALDRSRTPARRPAHDPTITSRTDASPDSPTRRDDINGVLTEILREPGHRYGVQVRQDGFASAIELACSPLLQAHGISLGDIRWIVDVRDRQRYQWCDIQGFSHIRLIMSRDLPTDMGGTPLFSSPTAPTGSAEAVIDSFAVGENRGAGQDVGQPRNNTRTQRRSDQHIGHAEQDKHCPTLHMIHMRECHHKHTLLARSQSTFTSVPPKNTSQPQAAILHARPCWGAETASPSVEGDQYLHGSGGSLEDWLRGILLGWCTAFSLMIRYWAETKQGNKWITHSGKMAGGAPLRRMRPWYLLPRNGTDEKAYDDGQQHIDGPAEEPKTPKKWEKKREDILNLLQKAEQAADKGDQRTVYQVVRRLAPWQPRQRVMIKDPNGRLLTLQQEHEALVSYSEDLFAPDTAQPAREGQSLNLVFTVEEIESQLKSIKIGKAVPPGVAPASAWRLAAPQVAKLLKMAFDQHSHPPGITLPLQWTDAWIVWLPKPGKDPCEPSSLRPIGLMSPDAKTLAGLLKVRLYELIRPQLRWVPQFAYQPGRDLYDALARVQVWIENFKRSLKDLGAGESMTAEIISLLDTSRYHIISDQEQSSVGTTRGIRQGCKIAPMLWVAISTLLLEQLGDALSGPHRQATTFADDTLVQWLKENSEDIAQLSSFINKLLGVMQDMGLLVNLTKTVLLLKVCGPGARRALKDYVVHKEGKKWWRARHPDGSEALIPIACYTTYLGTHLSLQTEAHKVVGYRIAEANKRAGKIRKATRSRKVFGLAHRVRIWQTCAASSATFGLIAFAPSAKAVALLRGWFYRQLRAVADSPAHISHESNRHLRQRLGVQDPIDATIQRIRHKLDKLRVAETSIINQPQTLQYWENMLQQYLIFHTDNIDAEPDSRLIPVPAQQSQPVACQRSLRSRCCVDLKWRQLLQSESQMQIVSTNLTSSAIVSVTFARRPGSELMDLKNWCTACRLLDHANIADDLMAACGWLVFFGGTDVKELYSGPQTSPRPDDHLQDGFASAIELACSPLLQAHGISLGDIRWIVDVRDRQRYQWCDIQGFSHIRLIMSRDLPTDMGGTPLFSSPTAPTGSAEAVIDSFAVGENRGAGQDVGQPRNNTRTQRRSDQHIGHAEQDKHCPTLHMIHMRECHHKHTLLARSQSTFTSVPPKNTSQPQAAILHARPCWGAETASPSVEGDQYLHGSGGSLEDWLRGILLGWCTAFSLMIRYWAETKQGNKWITHSGKMAGGAPLRRMRPWYLLPRNGTDEKAYDDGQQHIDGPAEEPKTPKKWEKKREDILNLLQKAEQDPNGRLLTLQQEHEALVSYSEDLFAPDTAQPAREGQSLNLVFTVEEIESQLKSIKIGKAVPPGVAPASAWRLAAPQVAKLLKMAFDQHSHPPGITLPLQWTDAWIVWLPKPGKDPCEPSSLRPIGLMSPDAKTLAGLLKVRLYELIRPQLRWVPQFAYQPGRDLYDALARVQVWIENFKRCYDRGNSSRSKCLPLLQIFLSRHDDQMDDQALQEVANMWEQHSPMELIMRDRPTEEENGGGRKFRPREGKGPGKAKREPIPAQPRQVQVLTKYVSQHAMALQLLEADRSWVLWMDSGALGIIPQLVKTTATWKRAESRTSAPAAYARLSREHSCWSCI